MKDFGEAVRYFRKFDKIASVDRVIEHVEHSKRDIKEKLIMISAADHRRAEIANQRVFNPGEVPGWAWAAVS